ncbi:Serine-threonine/tyrosine-protein kinase [Klebsormidium nitens]|uniref:non-specific serine/threonine protein kinase n=1 Tax=Klebsormidium nitens TaxID=105231 RepID=A0A1Y1IR21_KLENI|nr:Serine-threonine/tyrosine-protein kinase [Klebsormidium nitens]|eukprot:GAQ91077.1 Serine-threonine/tyrosine-protein kinase [Klebsormidium nitens]
MMGMSSGLAVGGVYTIGPRCFSRSISTMSLSAPMLFFWALALLAAAVVPSGADYVETAPRPDRPLPPPIPNGECPLTFLPADTQRALAVCSADGSASSAAGPSSACCSLVTAGMFASRVRYANSTGRLLLPQASAEACVQALNALLAAGGGPPVAACGLSSSLLTEEAGAACGPGLTTVYDFWEAANHTFPGLVGLACYEAADCTSCLASIRSAILSLGAAATPATLSSDACQGLAQVAMTAAAHPLLIANGLSQCLHKVDISRVQLSTRCTAFDWEAANFTAVQLSCGPQQVRKDRCCDLFIGMYGQVHAIYTNRTGHPIPQEEADVCMAGLRAALQARGVSPSVVDVCRIQAILPSVPIGCYNQTAAGQMVPAHYIDYLEERCNPRVPDCTACQRSYYEVGAQLANTSSATILTLCVLFMSAQYLARFDNLQAVTDRLNCYFVFPPPLALGLPAPPSKTWVSTGAILGIASGCAALIALAGLVVYGGCRPRWRRHHVLPHVQLQRFSLAALRRATDNWDERRLLGEGGWGRVYRGTLRSGEAVAVKVATHKNLARRTKAATREVLALARCRHRNLVALKGFCLTGDDCVLVFEYLAGGNLGDRLLTDGAAPPALPVLDWPTRLSIAQGAARGLAYLHESCKPRLLHRDVKPSNVLLSSTLEPKLADFGLAKVLDLEESAVTTDVVGTWGYLAPEYFLGGQVTDKVDVYSFGVLLLTLVAGRKLTADPPDGDQAFLPEWAWILAERGQLADLVDARLGSGREQHAHSIEQATRVALLCIHTAVSVRPCMRECLAMLEGHLPVPPLPPRPTTLYTGVAPPNPPSAPS